MTKKEKTPVAPNECSVVRWIVVLAVGLGLGFMLSPIASMISGKMTAPFFGIPAAQIELLLGFVVMFAGMAFAIRFIGKTSLKDFVLGVGGKVNIKQSLIVLGLYAVGLVFSFLIVIDNLRVRDVNPAEFGVLVLVMLLVAWMQTTWEEFVFRGVFIRWACKNKVGFTGKALIAGGVSSVLFASMHMFNPEVTGQSGLYIVLAGLSYLIPGIVMFVADLHFGSLLPGIIIHWINNFTLFTLVSSEVTAMPLPTLLVDTTPNTGLYLLVSTLVINLPLVVYILVDFLRKRKAVSAD